MPINPASLANLRPAWNSETTPKNFQKRSKDVDRTMRLAREGCPEAMIYTMSVLRDVTETTRYRLKAAEIVLNAGMPKGTAAQINLGQGSSLLRVEIVDPAHNHAHEAGPVTISFDGNGNPS